REPDPAEPERRREIPYGRAAVGDGRGAKCAAFVEGGQARGEDLDRVASRDEPLRELPEGVDRAPERLCRAIGWGREEYSQSHRQGRTLTSSPVAAPGVRPNILIINQYYWPGLEATAQLLTELAEDLTTDFDVTVITSVLYQHE